MSGNLRQHAHELVDQLPEAQISGLVQFLQAIVESDSYSLATAPLDDEPLTEADRLAIAEGVEWLRHNEPISHEELFPNSV